jgi:hypothetical protein
MGERRMIGEKTNSVPFRYGETPFATVVHCCLPFATFVHTSTTFRVFCQHATSAIRRAYGKRRTLDSTSLNVAGNSAFMQDRQNFSSTVSSEVALSSLRKSPACSEFREQFEFCVAERKGFEPLIPVGIHESASVLQTGPLPGSGISPLRKKPRLQLATEAGGQCALAVLLTLAVAVLSLHGGTASAGYGFPLR